jgi:hypothetical protein
MNKLNFCCILLLTIFFIGCEKGPYSIGSDGYVMDRSDSSKISFASVKLMHWDGNKKNDTVFVMAVQCDSSGKFDFYFESDHKHEFYWVKAAKEGYSNSSWGNLDVQWSNSNIIYLDKE